MGNGWTDRSNSWGGRIVKHVLVGALLLVSGVICFLPPLGWAFDQTAIHVPEATPNASTYGRGLSPYEVSSTIVMAENLPVASPGTKPAPPAPSPGSQKISPDQTSIGREAPSVNAAVSGEDYSGGPRYRMGPEDVIRLSVWGNKELTLDVVVRPDGKISVPLIQDVQAEGLSAHELAQEIGKRLQEYIKDPQVSIIVLQVNSSKFYIIGNIKNPGLYPLRGNISLLQALSLAGGFTEFASPRRIRLVRKSGDQQEVRVINYYDVIEKGGVMNYLLRPGDTVVVP